jgi:hypothetical protein
MITAHDQIKLRENLKNKIREKKSYAKKLIPRQPQGGSGMQRTQMPDFG